MNQPATIKAAEWDTIADAVKRGDVEARDNYDWKILEQVYETPLSPDFMEFREVYAGGVVEVHSQHIDDVFYLTWKQPAPPTSTIEALLATIETGLGLGKTASPEANAPWFNEAQVALAQLRQQMQAMEADIKDLHLTMRVHHSYLETIRERAGNGAKYTDKQARREILEWTLYSLRELNPWLWKFEDAHNMPPATDNPRFVPPDEKQS